MITPRNPHHAVRVLASGGSVFAICCCALGLVACTSILELRHTGDVLALQYAGEEINCELLAVTDSMLYLIPTADNDPALGLVAGMIHEAPPSLFHRGEVQGYMNRSWMTPVLLFQLVPTVMLAVEAFTYEGNDSELRFILPTLGAISMLNMWILHSGTDDAPGFTRSLMPEELPLLRRYARYPQGLTAEQLDLLLSVRNQRAARPLPVPMGS